MKPNTSLKQRILASSFGALLAVGLIAGILAFHTPKAAAAPAIESFHGIAVPLGASPAAGAASLPVGSPLAGVVSCGTSATCATPSYLAGGQIVIGEGTFATGAVTITGIPNFTSTSTFHCWASDNATVGNGPVKAALVSASSITLTANTTSGNTDPVDYVCIGN